MQRTLALEPLSPKAPEGAGRAPDPPPGTGPLEGAKGNVNVSALRSASIRIEQAPRARRRRLAGCGFRRSLLHLI